VTADAAVMIDDIEANCDGARAVGLAAVLFTDTQQTIDAVQAILNDDGSGQSGAHSLRSGAGGGQDAGR